MSDKRKPCERCGTYHRHQCLGVRATQPSPRTAEGERALFEAWAKPQPYWWNGQTYSDLHTQVAWEAWQAGRAALAANAARTPEDDAREIAEIWDCAKAEAAMYVEAHCVDGEMHAEYIMQQPRPMITPLVRANAADSEAKERDAARYRFLRQRTVAWNALRAPEWKTGAKLDATIDAAMKATQKGSTNE